MLPIEPIRRVIQKDTRCRIGNKDEKALYSLPSQEDILMSKKLAAKKIKNISEVAILLLVDLLSLIAIFELSILIRTTVLPLLHPFPTEPPFKNPANLWWVLLVWIFFFWYENLYTKRFSFWDEVEALVKVCFFSTAGIFTIISIGKLSNEISRTLVVVMGILSVVLLPGIRIQAKNILRKAGFLRRKVLIIGATDSGRLIARALRKETNYGYQVIGFLDDDPQKFGSRIDGIKVHRGINKALAYTRRSGVTDLFIAVPSQERDRIRELIGSLQHKVDRLLFVPDMFGIVVLETTLVHFFHEQVFAFEIQNNLSRPMNILVKRLFDILVSILLLAFLAIPMTVIAVLIKLNSRGPIFFYQERVGKKGRTFKCYKFRTMHADAEKRLTRLLASNAKARQEWETHWKLKNDPRVTRIGSFLRTTSLDELPQLFNVIRGEMSIVGPRPVVQEEIEKYYKDMAELCFSVPPGITGLWQVSGRTETSYDSRIGFDSWYVKNWNLWIDIMIALKTVRAVLRREGAY